MITTNKVQYDPWEISLGDINGNNLNKTKIKEKIMVTIAAGKAQINYLNLSLTT
jgi:hypothetical protein